MEHKYQWSIFIDETRNQQFVVRCDDYVEFLEAMENIRGLLRQFTEAPRHVLGSSEPEPEIPHDFCAIHNQPMKERNGRNGGHWYDHRWQEETVWYICNGKQVKKQ